MHVLLSGGTTREDLAPVVKGVAFCVLHTYLKGLAA